MTYGPWKLRTRAATCGALQPKSKARFRLRCSERPRHSGDHVARGMSGQELERWRAARREAA